MSKLTEDQLVIILEEIKKDLELIKSQVKQPTNKEEGKINLKIDQIISFLSRGGDNSGSINTNQGNENKRLFEEILQRLGALKREEKPPLLQKEGKNKYLIIAVGLAISFFIGLSFVSIQYVKTKELADRYRIVRYISANKENKFLDGDLMFQGSSKDSLLVKASIWEIEFLEKFKSDSLIRELDTFNKSVKGKK